MATGKPFNFFDKCITIWMFCIVIELLRQTSGTIDEKNTNKDAKTIVDSKFDPKTIEKILLYRTQEECSAINQAIAALNGGKPLVDPKYVPLQNTKPYDDLLFALVSDSLTVFSMYLGHYLDEKDETSIIMIFIQIDDRLGFKELYDRQHNRSFEEARKKQRHPFQNALRVWAEENRLPSDKPNVLSDVCLKGQDLPNERSKWNDKSRDGLEYILMKEGYEDSKLSVNAYGKGTEHPRDFIEDIKSNINNHDLVDLYTSLVRYVQNGDLYLAQVLHDHCDGLDNWTMWIIILTTRRGNPMEPIDEAFKSQYKNIALSEYVSKCNIPDLQFKDMLRVLADSSSASSRQKPPSPPPPPSEEYFRTVQLSPVQHDDSVGSGPTPHYVETPNSEES